MTGTRTDPSARSVTVRVPAKVNVQLVVGPPRPDGFHDLANVFLAVGLYDEVTAQPLERGEEPRVTVTGPDADRVPTDGDNLAARAAVLLAERHGVRPAVSLAIAKDIPVAGGMAGGSADAAAALVACDALWGTRASRAELLDLCAELGSDVPFSLVGGAALGRGRGERLTALPVGGVFHWVFAVADGGLSTPEVYRECDRLRALETGTADQGLPAAPADPGIPVDPGVPVDPEPTPAVLEALRRGDPVALAAAVGNDLQAAAVSLRPSLADPLAVGTAAGALAALVSGSGPTCAFLTPDAGSAAAVAEALTASGTCRTARVTTGPAPGAVLVTGSGAGRVP